jgi:hypothetical protein
VTKAHYAHIWNITMKPFSLYNLFINANKNIFIKKALCVIQQCMLPISDGYSYLYSWLLMQSPCIKRMQTKDPSKDWRQVRYMQVIAHLATSLPYNCGGFVHFIVPTTLLHKFS